MEGSSNCGNTATHPAAIATVISRALAAQTASYKVNQLEGYHLA